MFVKYGNEEHLAELKDAGRIFFNPCRYFRDIEEEQKRKGIGDGNDGGLHVVESKAWLSDAKGSIYAGEATTSVIVEPALSTPVFCLRKTDTEYISAAYREKLREQFPNHTHALIIKDENAFLENIRFSFRNKAFAHSIFYQDRLFIDFFHFLKSGSSDIMFYSTKRKNNSYYAKMIFCPEDSSLQNETFLIDDSNFYRSMFRKELFFQDQLEYRIVLPYERIHAGQKYQINPFEATLCSIDSLIQEDNHG